MRANLILFGATAAMIAIVVAYIFNAGERSKEAALWRQSVATYVDQSERSWTAGWNLETGLNDYKSKTLELDKKVANEKSTHTDNHFNADSVQRISQRIAAGEAARKSIH